MVVAAMFGSFALAYFLSALVRGVTATLAPALSAELGLRAGDLGLLGGAYFLGFAVFQLPVGIGLDRFGPKRVLLGLVAVAVAACAAFALAQNFWGLTLARGAIGVGVSACLMAPMTAFRLRLAAPLQVRLNAWMLMAGSSGMLASTVPVQWLLPSLGWRGLFWAIAACFALAWLALWVFVPTDSDNPPSASRTETGSWRQLLRNPVFVAFAPVAFFVYGGLIALQSLWVGPWLTLVGGQSPAAAAQGLAWLNGAMLLSFLAWGYATPRLFARGWSVPELVTWGVPVSLFFLGLGVWWGAGAGAGVWALFCVSTTVVSLSQPAIGQAFEGAWAGRALTTYNLVIFAGVFLLQWGLGLAMDGFVALGAAPAMALRGAFALLWLGSLLSYVWLLWRTRNWGQGRRAPGAQ